MSLKLFAALIPFVLITTSFAAEPVELRLESREITAATNNLILIRTANTPRKVFLTVPVVYQSSFCTQSQVTRVFGSDPSCGAKPCLSQIESLCSSAIEWASCYHDQESCVSYGTTTVHENASFKLKFEKRKSLGADEVETYRFNAVSPSIVAGGPLDAETVLVIQ